ncbi:MAG: hypothetical protein K6B43_07845 [Treponema sp.]|jgi:hypothetical protein|nr:hypothetical protein [Treponema sp.]
MEENEEKKRKPRSRERGPGKAGTHRVSFAVSCQPNERDEIREKAEALGMTISELVIESVRAFQK